jgi:hypothetical protein
MWRFLAFLRSFFHSSLLYTFSYHSSPPTILPSSPISSCYLFLGLPLGLVFCLFIFLIWHFMGPENEGEYLQQIFVWNHIIAMTIYVQSVMCFLKSETVLVFCIVPPTSHVCDVNRLCCVFLCWIPKRSTFIGGLSHVYIKLYHQIIVVGIYIYIYMVTCLTARKIDVYTIHIYLIYAGTVSPLISNA